MRPAPHLPSELYAHLFGFLACEQAAPLALVCRAAAVGVRLDVRARVHRGAELMAAIRKHLRPYWQDAQVERMHEHYLCSCAPLIFGRLPPRCTWLSPKRTCFAGGFDLIQHVPMLLVLLAMAARITIVCHVSHFMHDTIKQAIAKHPIGWSTDADEDEFTFQVGNRCSRIYVNDTYLRLHNMVSHCDLVFSYDVHQGIITNVIHTLLDSTGAIWLRFERDRA